MPLFMQLRIVPTSGGQLYAATCIIQIHRTLPTQPKQPCLSQHPRCRTRVPDPAAGSATRASVPLPCALSWLTLQQLLQLAFQGGNACTLIRCNLLLC